MSLPWIINCTSTISQTKSILIRLEVFSRHTSSLWHFYILLVSYVSLSFLISVFSYLCLRPRAPITSVASKTTRRCLGKRAPRQPGTGWQQCESPVSSLWTDQWSGGSSLDTPVSRVQGLILKGFSLCWKALTSNRFRSLVQVLHAIFVKAIFSVWRCKRLKSITVLITRHQFFFFFTQLCIQTNKDNRWVKDRRSNSLHIWLPPFW